ncbi:arsenate reductase/protein-tyrosine-phosphatase family protein [Nonomuraea cavernae]|uniref:ArsR family transcriptional regulator n=1 Tax=Nonomuraea cavernae TaxID=2045107 RepID=A0A917ZH61_9ACTN|nr:ArsR family transcriptional regulator [Nonomuraea cavernae]MCA2190874.1 ArsR family transcriptional regulator [Nonomuraea cavernae]GGO82926.1 ArsR family transcriptional regulator [Nonomuraea cavernae]
MASSLQAAPAFVQLAAHPVRWRLLTLLAAGDHRVRELVELVGQPQNLVSYHLRLLRGGGLVTARRSTFDARDSYYHLDLERCAQELADTGAVLHPALRLDPAPPSPPSSAAHAGRPVVLFTCTGNSARSPIAEALLRHHAGGRVEVTSAGSHPRPRLHPYAVHLLRERHGIDLIDQRPRHVDTMAGRRFDYVISLCDKVREVCPDIGGHPRRLHWSIPDPATPSRTEGAGSPAFARTMEEIDTRIRYLLPVLTPQEVSS